MTIIAVGKNERIEYRNTAKVTEDENYFGIFPTDGELVEVVVNGHMVASSDEIIIEKRCFICNELYIDNEFCYHDTDSIKVKALLNKKYGEEVKE